MSTISLYPKTWALYQHERLSLMKQHGILLVTADYVYSPDHRDYSDVPVSAIAGEASLTSIQYEGASNRFTVSDGTARSATIVKDKTVTGFILFRQDEYEEDSRLVYYCNDVSAGFPFITTGKDVKISFPEGVLALAPTGYSLPLVTVVEAVVSPFRAQINMDMENNTFNVNEFGVSVIYTHYNNSSVQYNVVVTSKPDVTSVIDLDLSSVSQVIKMQNSKLVSIPRRGDKVLMEGVKYSVVGCSAENYTTDVFLQETV